MEADEDAGPREAPEAGFSSFAENGERNDPTGKLRVRAELFADHYSQPRLFYRSQTEIEQAHIASAFVFELSKVGLPHIRKRLLSRLRIVDEKLAKRVADGLAMPLPPRATGGREPVDMELSPALSIGANAKATLVGRKVGILFAEGSDRAEIARVKKAATDAGATVMLIAPKVGGIPVKGGTLEADGQLAGTPSVLVDAIAVVLSVKSAKKLAKDGAAVQFVMDAFGHLKAIGHNAGALPLLERAGVAPDDGVTDLSAAFVRAAARRFYDREPAVRDLA